jgi:hypothetical protein
MESITSGGPADRNPRVIFADVIGDADMVCV